MVRKFALALILAVGFMPVQEAHGVSFTAEAGHFQHYTNVSTIGDLLFGTLSTNDDPQQSAVLDLVFGVVTNSHPGQVHARVTLASIDEIIRNGELFPSPVNGAAHLIGAPQISFIAGVHTGLSYSNFSPANVTFAFIDDVLRINLAFTGVNISNHPRGPLSLWAEFGGISQSVPPTNVPEPSTLAMLGASLVAWRRRRTQT